MPIYEVQYKFTDSEGRTKDRLVLFDAVDEAELLTEAADMQNALAALSNCGVEEYTYRRTVVALDPPAPNSNVDPGATFAWNTTLPVTPTTNIPDPVDAVKDGQGGIDLSNALVVAYAQEYVANNARLNRTSPTQPSGIKRATLDV